MLKRSFESPILRGGELDDDKCLRLDMKVEEEEEEEEGAFIGALVSAVVELRNRLTRLTFLSAMPRGNSIFVVIQDLDVVSLHHNNPRNF